MKCKEVKQIVFTYLDGCLNGQVEEEFKTHLSHCTSCQRELEQARHFNDLLKSSCTLVQPPADFVDGVMGRIEEYEKSKKAHQAAVVSFKERAEKKQSFLEKLIKSPMSFSKVASFAALIAALSAFLAFAKLPEITKMADLGAKLNERFTIGTEDKSTPSQTGGTDQSGTGLEKPQPSQPTAPVTGSGEEETPGSGEENLPEQTETKDVNPEEPADQKPSQPEAPEEPAGQEEVTPELPRLDGPFRQVTGITSVVAKSVSLTPISQDDNFISLKPSWDERGKKIYYFSNKEANEGSLSLWAKDLNDDSVQVIARNVAKSVSPDKPGDKSPDGKYKLYQEQGQVFVAKTDGSEAKPLTPKLEGAEFTYAWRPDGKSVAISVKGSPSQGLWLADAEGSGWSLITASGGGNSLSWSPDGRKIAFTGTNNMIYVGVLVAENKTNLLMVVPEGDKQGDVTLAWSPDSQRLLFDWAKEGSTKGVYLATIPQ